MRCTQISGLMVRRTLSFSWGLWFKRTPPWCQWSLEMLNWILWIGIAFGYKTRANAAIPFSTLPPPLRVLPR